MTSEPVTLVEGVDDMQLGLLRIYDALNPAADFAELVMLAAEALDGRGDPIARGAYACLEAIRHAKQMVNELRETGRVDEDKRED
jgi:hypothetical protein